MSNMTQQTNLANLKKFCSNKPYSLLLMMKREGSQSMKKSQCYKTYDKLISQCLLPINLKSILIPIFIFNISAFLIRRRRGFALTSGTILKNITVKYIPAIIAIRLYQFTYNLKVDSQKIETNFYQIEDEFKRIFDIHGQQYMNFSLFYQMIAV